MHLRVEKLFSFVVIFLVCLPIYATERLITEPELGRGPIIAEIYKAKSHLGLVMYGFTDPELMHALIKAKERGIYVKTLLEPAPYKAKDENVIAFKKFRAANIAVLPPNPFVKLTHQKTLLMDGKEALVMTFNFTRSTFTTERNFGLVIDNPKMLAEIENVFKSDAEGTKVHVNEPDLVWSPNNSRKKILKLIASAQHHIDIYAQDITDYQIIGALAHAAREGIKIKIILPKNIKHAGKLKYLVRSGVKVHHSRSYHIHAKVLIIDGARAMLGSINFTKASLDSNRELSVITSQKNIVNQLLLMLHHDYIA